MKRQLHNSDEVFISPQQGWEQMQLLLDKKLPVKNEKPGREFYFLLMVAASFVTIFLLGTLALNNTVITNSFNREVGHSVAKIPAADTGNIHDKSGVVALTKNATNGKVARLNNTKNLQTDAVVVSSDSDDLAFRKIAPPEMIEEIVYPKIKTILNQNAITKTAMIASPTDAANSDSTGLPDNTGKRHPKRTWNLSAGLAMNATIGQQQNFTPYPAAVLRYNISNKFFLSLGLLAGSHAPGNNRGVKKTVYVNDMVNNIQFYNAVDQYNDFTYADIPLLAGVNISKKISLQAGVQGSVLLKTKTKTVLEHYDFQMRLAGGGTTGLAIGTAAPVIETDYRVEARKIDYRFTTGIKYNINKLAFNLMYQHSLQPVLTGDLTSRNKHQLVTLNMQFTIK